MKIENLNSKVKVSGEDRIFAVAKATSFLSYLKKIPVYFVDQSLMDRIYPPRRRLFLQPECLKEMLASFEERISEAEERILEELPDYLGRLERCLREASPGYFVATGVYFSRLDSGRIEIVRDETGYSLNAGPAIFICPERVKESAESLVEEIPVSEEEAFRFCFAKVLVHELAHAFMDGGRAYGAFWERVIEESLANAFAYDAVAKGDDLYRLGFELLVERQPLEYKGWRYFLKHNFPPFQDLEALGSSWKRRTAPGTAPIRRFAPELWFYYPWEWVLWFLPEPERKWLWRRLWRFLPHPWDDIFRRYGDLWEFFTRKPELFWASVAFGLLNRISEKNV